MAGEAIPARNEQFCPIIECEGNRGGIRFLRFFARIIGATGLPKFLAGLRVQRQQKRINGAVRAPSPMDRHIALEDLQIKPAAVKGRTAGEGPLKGELAVVALDVAGPNLFAVEIECRELTVAVEEPDQLAIGDRRR